MKLLILLTVKVSLLTQAQPTALFFDGPTPVSVAAQDGALLVDGAPVTPPLELPHGTWTVGDREYVAALTVRAKANVLIVRGTFALEEYVARVTASETDPGTPTAALRAQAVVVRSFALRTKTLCDLAHCQVLRGRLAPGHLRAARRAARETVGLVLARGATPSFHASCGGHTSSAALVWGGPGPQGRPDPACHVGSRWTTELDAATFRAVTAELFDRRGVELRDLRLIRDSSRRVVQVADRVSGRKVSGERLALAFDAALDWGEFRSARFDWQSSGERVHVRGRGTGHGVGLCQAGARRRAQDGGESFREILAHYFPGVLVLQHSEGIDRRVDDRPRRGMR